MIEELMITLIYCLVFLAVLGLGAFISDWLLPKILERSKTEAKPKLHGD